MLHKISLSKLLLAAVVLVTGACGHHEQSLTRIDVGDESQKFTDCVGAQDCLFKGASSGDLTKLEYGVDEGADLNMLDNQGLTPLMIAVKSDAYISVEFLVDAGADLAVRSASDANEYPDMDIYEMTEKKLSAEEKVLAIVLKILGGEDFTVEVLSDEIKTAIDFFNVGLAKWLLFRGVDPNFVWKKKNSPLIYLFSKRGVKPKEMIGLREIYYALVEHPDVDINLKLTRRNITALVNAKKRLKKDSSYQEFVDDLISKGAVD